MGEHQRGVGGEPHDPGRIDFLRRYLRGFKRAADEGIPTLGYFQWSILDNFEWAFGFSRRFGIVYVDFETLERVPKDSFKWYRDLIAAQRASRE